MEGVNEGGLKKVEWGGNTEKKDEWEGFEIN